jgi:hypothetical protein
MGKLAGKQLPLVGRLSNKQTGTSGRRVLIVQAETRPDGGLVYGAIARYGMLTLRADDLAEVCALKKSDEKIPK